MVSGGQGDFTIRTPASLTETSTANSASAVSVSTQPDPSERAS